MPQLACGASPPRSEGGAKLSSLPRPTLEKPLRPFYDGPMHPILFEIPGIHLPLRSFGVMVMLGFLAGAHFLTRWGVRGAPDPEKAQVGYSALPIWVLLGVIFGARFLYVAVEIAGGTPTGEGYKEDPLSIFFIWQGGLVMYGGALGGILGGWFATMKHDLPVAQVMDLGVPAAFLGLAIGRVGCLLVGDDYGRVASEAHASLPFPIVVRVPEVLPEGSLFGVENQGKVLYCTQLWMSFNALLLFLIGRFVLLPRRRFGGQVAATLLLLYSGAISSNPIGATRFAGCGSTTAFLRVN